MIAIIRICRPNVLLCHAMVASVACKNGIMSLEHSWGIIFSYVWNSLLVMGSFFHKTEKTDCNKTFHFGSIYGHDYGGGCSKFSNSIIYHTKCISTQVLTDRFVQVRSLHLRLPDRWGVLFILIRSSS